MKIPQWMMERLADLGQQILDDEITISDAGDELAGKIMADDRALALAVLSEFTKRRLRQWVYARIRDKMGDRQVAAQLVLPFPDLPVRLEVAPGREVHQNVMTARDWDNARAIWRNRRDQAEVSFQKFEVIYERIRPLLTDETLTTADVINQLDGPASATQ